MAKNKKIVRYRRPFHINIGLIVFGIIFFYIMFYIYSYFTSVHISAYEVVPGSIAMNNTYTGLALRQEETVLSESTGTINYYVKDASRVGAHSLIYSVDSDGTIARQIAAASEDVSSLDKESLDKIQNRISSYTGSYSSDEFYEVYTLKTDLNAELSEAINLQALSSVRDTSTAAVSSSDFHTPNAGKPGVVVYYTDGFETVTTENFTVDMFDESTYKKVNLKDRDSISTGDTVCKLITDENWNLVIPVENDTVKNFENASTIRIRFKKDGTVTRASLTIQKKEDTSFLILGLSDSMIRFATDRFIEVELLMDEESRLKIPNSAIVTKNFFTIPMEYFQKGNNSNDMVDMVRKTGKNEENEAEFVALNIYFSTETNYYVDGDKVKDGDIIQKPDSLETYTVHDVAELSGVYCINKGYAVFRHIDVIYENEEYSILRSGTDYGISLYDHIALDGSAITENDLIHE